MVRIMNNKVLDDMVYALMHYTINETKDSLERKEKAGQHYYHMLVSMNKFLFDKGYITGAFENRILNDIL